MIYAYGRGGELTFQNVSVINQLQNVYKKGKAFNHK